MPTADLLSVLFGAVDEWVRAHGVPRAPARRRPDPARRLAPRRLGW